MKYVILALIGLVVVLAVIYGLMLYSTTVKEQQLRNLYQTKEKSVNNCFSTCFAIIKQTAQITDAARESFERVYPEIMAGRGMDKGGQFMKWLQESAPPSFDINKNFDRLMTIVEEQRGKLKTSQDEWLSIANDYNTFSENPLTRWFIGVKDKMDPKIIVVAGADEAIKTRVESDLNLNLGGKKTGEKP